MSAHFNIDSFASTLREMPARERNGRIGEEIVSHQLRETGWDVANVNDDYPNHPNYDLVATRNSRSLRLQVKAKEHKYKTCLAGSWRQDEPTFNKSDDVDPADFLIMVRFKDQDYECFVLPIDEAETKAEWFASELIKIDRSTTHLYPYVGKSPRHTTVYKFNDRSPWEAYSNAWHLLND
jgi:hypothetical protein